MTASHSSSEVLTSIRSRTNPALLTRMSSPPYVSIACSTIAAACAKSATSAPLTTASPTSGHDLGDDLVGRRLPGSLAGQRDAEVVDNHLGAVPRPLQRVGAADATARSGHDRDPALEKLAHHAVPSALRGPFWTNRKAGRLSTRRDRRRVRGTTYNARSLARNTTTFPTSSGRAIRPSRMVRSIAATDGVVAVVVVGVLRCGTGRRRSSSPAPSAPTPSPGTRSASRDRPSPRRTPRWSVPGGRAETEEMFADRRPSSSCSCMTAFAAWATSSGLSRLRPTILSWKRGDAGGRRVRRRSDRRC